MLFLHTTTFLDVLVSGPVDPAASPRGRSLCGRMAARLWCALRLRRRMPTAAAERGLTAWVDALALRGLSLLVWYWPVCISCVRSSSVGAMTSLQQPCITHVHLLLLLSRSHGKQDIETRRRCPTDAQREHQLAEIFRSICRQNWSSGLSRGRAEPNGA